MCNTSMHDPSEHAEEGSKDQSLSVLWIVTGGWMPQRVRQSGSKGVRGESVCVEDAGRHKTEADIDRPVGKSSLESIVETPTSVSAAVDHLEAAADCGEQVLILCIGTYRVETDFNACNVPMLLLWEVSGLQLLSTNSYMYCGLLPILDLILVKHPLRDST